MYIVKAWDVQVRVLKALMIRELTTRFGRENIGFLWVMVEPLLFAGLIAILWRAMKGPFEFGVDIVVFVISGYIPLVMFRSIVNRTALSITANGSLMYHRQVKLFDIILVRFLLEFIGHMMAYLFIASALIALGLFPIPHDLFFLIIGWLYFSLFSFAVGVIVAPASEISDVIEKFIPVFNYAMIPFSGAFFLLSSLKPEIAAALLYAPPVHGMEMMRYGLFGPAIDAQFDFVYPLKVCLPMILFGMVICRHVKRRMVIE
jgi:capsular polysaccharide transport system permease protein